MLSLAEPRDKRSPRAGSMGMAGSSSTVQGSVHRLNRGPVLVRLIDDRTLFRESLAAALSSIGDIAVEQASPADADADLQAVARGMHVVLIALDRRGATEGPFRTLIARLLALANRPAVAVIVDGAGPAPKRGAARLGVDALITTDTGLSPLAEVLRRLRAARSFPRKTPDRGT